MPPGPHAAPLHFAQRLHAQAGRDPLRHLLARQAAPLAVVAQQRAKGDSVLQLRALEELVLRLHGPGPCSDRYAAVPRPPQASPCAMITHTSAARPTSK